MPDSNSANRMSGGAPGADKTFLGREIAFLVLLSLIWGSSFTLIKVAVGSIPPMSVTAARVTIAAILLVGIARMQGFKLPRQRSVWGNFLVQGVFQCAVPFTLINWGE